MENIMTGAVLPILAIILILFGLTALIEWVTARMLTPRNSPKSLLIVPLGNHPRDTEIILRNLDFKARSLGGDFCSKIIAVDCGMDSETREICTASCGCFSEIRLCSPEELSVAINEELLGISEA